MDLLSLLLAINRGSHLGSFLHGFHALGGFGGGLGGCGSRVSLIRGEIYIWLTCGKIFIIIDLVPSQTVCLASSPGRMRQTNV